MLVNGSWTGGIGVLQRKEADICSVPTGIEFNQTSNELQHFGFTAFCFYNVFNKFANNLVRLKRYTGVNKERADFIDYPLPIYWRPRVLISSQAEGTSLNMWAYVQVFGIIQWTTFFVLLVMTVVLMSMFQRIANRERSIFTYIEADNSCRAKCSSFFPAVCQSSKEG